MDNVHDHEGKDNHKLSLVGRLVFWFYPYLDVLTVSLYFLPSFKLKYIKASYKK